MIAFRGTPQPDPVRSQAYAVTITFFSKVPFPRHPHRGPCLLRLNRVARVQEKSESAQP